MKFLARFNLEKNPGHHEKSALGMCLDSKIRELASSQTSHSYSSKNILKKIKWNAQSIKEVKVEKTPAAMLYKKSEPKLNLKGEECKKRDREIVKTESSTLTESTRETKKAKHSRSS